METGPVWHLGDSHPIGGPQLPNQGWKIHVTATPDTAEKTIEQTWAVCRRLNLSWKFLRSRRVTHVLNSKYASRAASGKVVTVYPRDTEELRIALTELDAVLGGRPGPYILSDHRWNTGPVSVRYGAFTLMWCELPDGSRCRHCAIRRQRRPRPASAGLHRSRLGRHPGLPHRQPCRNGRVR